MRVNSRVAPLMPSSAERRVITRGPRGTGPSCSGPQRSSSQGVPLRLTGSPPGGTGTRRSSAGGRCSWAGATPPAGSRADSTPTSRARASNTGKLCRQRRQGSPLKAVTSNSSPTRARRQPGPARIGVSRKARVQASFRRGSRPRSQLPVPSTYWPMGSCRNQSI